MPKSSLTLLIAQSSAAVRQRSKLARSIDKPNLELEITTWDRFCAQVIKEWPAEAGIDPFIHLASFTERIAILLDHSNKTPLPQLDSDGRPALTLSRAIQQIDLLKTRGISAEAYDHWAQQLSSTDSATKALAQEFAQLYCLHDRLLSEAGMIDQLELQQRTLRLIQCREEIREQLRLRYKQVLVDESEALSSVQKDLALELSATNENFLTNKENSNASYPNSQFLRFSSELSQAKNVATQIAELVTQAKCEPQKIAVFHSSNTHTGQLLAKELENWVIPWERAGQTSFFELVEVKDLLAWLRLFADPSDSSAACRALGNWPINLSSIEIARCLQTMRRRQIDIFAALETALADKNTASDVIEKVQLFLKLYNKLAPLFETEKPNIFIQLLRDELQPSLTQIQGTNSKYLNLARFYELVATYSRKPNASTREWVNFLQAIIQAQQYQPHSISELTETGVAIMPTSCAKGLEFEHVFVLDLQVDLKTANQSPFTQIPNPIEVTPSTMPLLESNDSLLDLAMGCATKQLVLSYVEYNQSKERTQPLNCAGKACVAAGAEWECGEEQIPSPQTVIQALFLQRSHELIDTVIQTGAQLNELRLDTEAHLSNAIVNYAELIKLAALVSSSTQKLSQTLPELNTRLTSILTSAQQELLLSSELDDQLIAAQDGEFTLLQPRQIREQSLAHLLPKRGLGLSLSVSDIETYRSCPLRYKFARILRLPAQPTTAKSFGILCHQVLERYHTSDNTSLSHLEDLYTHAWSRSGIERGDNTKQLKSKGMTAFRRYHEHFIHEQPNFAWLERGFTCRIGKHTVRGRVDRIDRLENGSYELIDYKTGRPKSPELKEEEDIQLVMYALGASEDWNLQAQRGTYYYLLDDQKQTIELGGTTEWVKETVSTVAEQISKQEFDPTPSERACSICDYRILCPAAERS